jgi:alpha-N-arabinofuranosidase
MSEAAFMTGLERNADVVNMASYAPLFAHVEGWQWPPDLDLV